MYPFGSRDAPTTVSGARILRHGILMVVKNSLMMYLMKFIRH